VYRFVRVGGVGFVHTTTVRLPSRTKRLFSIAGFRLKRDWPIKKGS